MSRLTRKFTLGSAAWGLSGEINADKNCVHCNGGLTTMSGEVDARFIVVLSPFDLTKGCVGGGKVGRLTRKFTLGSGAWGLSGEINAAKNCVHCSGGLTTMSGEVDARFIVILSPIGLAKGRRGGGKVGPTDLNITMIQRRGGFQVR